MTTYGQKAVGLDFNPSANPDVDRVKTKFAEIIDLCHELMAQANGPEHEALFIEAIRESMTAQMWCVKALTWRYAP
jgi:hypothetical protein